VSGLDVTLVTVVQDFAQVEGSLGPAGLDHRQQPHDARRSGGTRRPDAWASFCPNSSRRERTRRRPCRFALRPRGTGTVVAGGSSTRLPVRLRRGGAIDVFASGGARAVTSISVMAYQSNSCSKSRSSRSISAPRTSSSPTSTIHGVLLAECDDARRPTRARPIAGRVPGRAHREERSVAAWAWAFPGSFIDGHVVRPGNLSRPGAWPPRSRSRLDAQWRGFALQDELCEKTGRDVRVVNDATMAALGCIEGHGHRTGAHPGYRGWVSPSPSTGRCARSATSAPRSFATARPTTRPSASSSRSLDELHWNPNCGHRRRFRQGVPRDDGAPGRGQRPSGGRRRVRDLPYRVVINGNEAPMRGAAKLFYD
jgi:hypothetical protein